MTDETDDRPAFVFPTGLLKFVVGGFVVSTLSCVGLKYYPFDSDSDGVPDKADKCPELAGVDGWSGCPDSDPDKDNVYVKIEGSVYYQNLTEEQLDQCPTKAGTLELFGCPPPTPEEVAMTAWKGVETDCSEKKPDACINAEAKLAALPVAEQTEERKAKAHAAEQLALKDSIEGDYGRSTKAQDIAGVEAQLAKVENEEDRLALRVDFDRDLWVSYYYDCSASNGVCSGWYKEPVGDADPQPMKRVEALQKVMAFYNGDLAYPKPEELVVVVVEHKYKPIEGLLAAKEWGVDEARLKVAFGLDGENFAFPESCDGNTDARFYGEAAKYGWFVTEALKCARENESIYRFKDAISFARMAGQPAEAARIERKLLEESLKRGEYSITAGGEPVILIENREGWLVGS